MKNINIISKIASICLVMVCIVANVSCATVDTGKIEAERIEAERIEAERIEAERKSAEQVALQKVEDVEKQIQETKNLFVRSKNNLITATGEFTDDYEEAWNSYIKAVNMYNELSASQRKSVEEASMLEDNLPKMIEWLEYSQRAVKSSHDKLYSSLKNPYTFEPKAFAITLWIDSNFDVKYIECVVEGLAENAFGGRQVVNDGLFYCVKDGHLTRESFQLTSMAHIQKKKELVSNGLTVTNSIQQIVEVFIN